LRRLVGAERRAGAAALAVVRGDFSRCRARALARAEEPRRLRARLGAGLRALLRLRQAGLLQLLLLLRRSALRRAGGDEPSTRVGRRAQLAARVVVARRAPELHLREAKLGGGAE